MVIPFTQRQKLLQFWLYSGVGLIVVSMLFLGRGQAQESTSFVAQALIVLAAPAFFYVTGMLVRRYLRAPLAAPGMIATGAWLIGVGLIHLYDKRILMPPVLQPYYWLGASLLAGVLITLTGHRVRIWMLVPLVPLVQVNVAWAIMSAVGIPVEWMPPVSFALVLLWWETPVKDALWVSVYRASAVVLSLFLLVFTIWLPLTTAQTLMVTWGAGAAVVAVLGLRHGWVRLGPLAIVMLTCASIWGLPASWWSPVWLVLAAGTVVFIERLGSREEKSKDAKAMEISEALAVALSGVSALLAAFAPLIHVPMHPLGTVGVLACAGSLLAWLGWRRQLRIAAHTGLWLVAAAWASLYFVTVPNSGTFGLWVALFAAVGLLVERLFISGRKEKRKAPNTLTETVTYWPVADLVIGLSTMILLWTAININAVSPWILTLTFGIVIGLWIAAGLIYRLPILLHVALWVAPLPYALLIVLAAPSLWTLSLQGITWQLLGVGFLVIGHSAPRYRPAILAPFFVVGYALLAFGFSVAITSATLMPASLTLIVVASIATSAAVIADYHPAWSAFVAWLIPPDKRPYAYKNVHHLFLLLSAWLAAIWLNLMLGYAGLPLPRQGMLLVAFAGAWFVLGRLLSRLPDVVGWPVISAAWVMWLTGLVEVFFSPAEAIVTVILGLLVSGEALRRSRQIYWIPAIIMQGFFTALQLAWLLALPGRVVLMLAAMGVSAGGMFYERQSRNSGRMTAISGGALALGIGVLFPDVPSILGISVLALVACVFYRRWQWLWTLYACGFALLVKMGVHLDWRMLLVAGVAQMVIAAELIRLVRPRKYRTLRRMFFNETDWATPPLWIGMFFVVTTFAIAPRMITPDLIAAALLVAALSAVYTARLRLPHLPYLTLSLLGYDLILIMLRITAQPLRLIGDQYLYISISLTLAAIVMYWLCRSALANPRRIAGARWLVWWLRPLLFTSYVLAGASLLLLLVMGSFYAASPIVRIANGVALVAFAGLLHAYKPQGRWLWAAVAVAYYTGTITLVALHLNGMLWQTVPLGVALLALARFRNDLEAVLFESAGIAVLLVGAGMSLDRTRLISPAAIPLAIHVGGLFIYGVVAGRRISFASALLIVIVGIVFAIAKINVWLIPLACGLLLLGGTLLMEVQRETAERWLTTLVTRWQRWR